MEWKGRKSISFLSIISVLFVFISLPLTCQETIENGRKTLEIIIGGGGSPPTQIIIGGGGSPPAPPGECPDCALPPEPCPPPSAPPEPSSPPLPPHLPPHPPSPSKPNPTPNPGRGSLPLNLRQALNVIKRLKDRIKGDPTGIKRTWEGKNICGDPKKYVGFVCNPKRRTVVGVNFNQRNLSGPNLGLQDFIEKLSKDLVFYHGNSNSLKGDIPAEIVTNLPRFYELDLSNNLFSGPFPKPIIASINLTFLDLRFNQFSGPVPAEVFALDLDVLFLNNNQFSGDLPDNLGKLPVLYLTLANNKFTGQLPHSIGEASRNLLEVLFFNNSLSGCLPYEIGKLKKTRLFDASFNQFTGPIPHSFGCLENMQVMNFSNNHLYGAVPESLCKLGRLQELRLEFNYFTQVGPKCRKLIMENVLNVTMNCILDIPFQRPPSQCTNFFSKPHSCPNPESMKIVPCEIDSLNSPQSRKKEIMAPSPAYAAIHNKHA